MTPAAGSPSNSVRPSWLPIVGLLVAVAGVLGWLLLVFAGDRSGVVRLPHPSAGEVEFLPEGPRPLTIEEAAQQPADAWQRLREAGLFVSSGSGPVWARVTLHNPSGRPKRGVLVNDFRWEDRTEAWVRDGGAWRRMLTGEAVAAREKAIRGRETAFPIEVPARGESVVYLRITDYWRRPVTLWGWWPEAADFFGAQARGLLAEGIYFGGLLALLGYNGLLWLRLRLPDIRWYVRYLGATAAFMLVMRAMPSALGATLASPRVEVLMAVALSLAGFSLTHFARVFLNLAAHSPRADRVARVLALLFLLLVADALSVLVVERVWGLRQVFAVSGLAHVVLPVCGVLAWRAGVWQARYFLASFALFFLSGIVSTFAWFSHIVTDLTQHALLIGSALEMLLLSLAVAERFARAQRQLVEETEQRRMIEETYAEELEIEVRERTHDLEQANADKDRMLAVIGHDLRSPLTGLMRSADEATGEFARETARTGRALLLLIEDLVLWGRLRAGRCILGVHPAPAVISAAVALHRTLAERGGTELVVEVPEDLRVQTDLVLAQTLVRNLLANALKFARTRVVLRAEKDANGGVRFTVSNDGPPLAPEVAARFAAGENEPMTATGGLGLRLCREICRALGTRLEATPRAEGAEFGFVVKTMANGAEKA